MVPLFFKIQRRLRSGLLPITLLMVLYPFVGPDASVSVYTILLAAVTLVHTRGFEDYLLCLLALLIGLESLALVYWIFNVPSPPLYWFANLEHALHGMSAFFAPYAAIVTMLMWIIKPLIEPHVQRLQNKGEDANSGTESRQGSIQLNKTIILIIAIIVAAVGAFYPNSPHINPESVLIGTDLPRINRIMDPVRDAPLSAFTAWGGSRPLFLLTVYVFERIIRLESREVLEILPILLLPLLSLSVYFMVSRATGDEEWASLSALFTAFGFHSTVGLYAYYVSNILGLTMIFFAIGLLFRDLNESSPFPVAASFLASLTIFTHPWTFTHFYVSIGVMGLIIGYRYTRGERGVELVAIIFFLGVNGLVNILKRVLLGGVDGVSAFTATAPMMIRLEDFWINNVWTFRWLYGGLLSNILILILSALGIYLLDHGKLYQFFLKTLIAISSAYYLIANATFWKRPRNLIPSRLLFNIPFGVFMALSVLHLLRNSQLKRSSRIFIFIFIILSMSVYLLRSLVNLVY